MPPLPTPRLDHGDVLVETQVFDANPTNDPGFAVAPVSGYVRRIYLQRITDPDADADFDVDTISAGATVSKVAAITAATGGAAGDVDVAEFDPTDLPCDQNTPLVITSQGDPGTAVNFKALFVISPV